MNITTTTFRCVLALLVTILISASAAIGAESRFIDQANDEALIEAALSAEAPATAPPPIVTGIIVPHHLLAADLIARGILAASGRRYGRIILIAPDHLRRVDRPFAVATASLPSVFGEIAIDEDATAALLEEPALFEPMAAAPGEHGIHSVTPFLKRVFPDATIIALAARTASPRAEIDAALDALTPFTDENTLVVQSTDFSHFLPIGEAVLRDQETITTIAGEVAEDVFALDQGSHLDSQVALYVMMRLQKMRAAQPVIIGNRTSAQYTGSEGHSVTSYVTAAYVSDRAAATWLTYPDLETVFFGGDVFAGRGFAELIDTPSAFDAVVDAVRAVTRGAPLLINLEGVVLPSIPNGFAGGQHVMEHRGTIRLLRALNAAGASLANNHAFDFGLEGHRTTVAALKAAGVAPIDHMRVTEFPSFSVAGLTARRSVHFAHPVVRTEAAARDLCELNAKAPLVVMAHWGKEGATIASATERSIAYALSRCGAAAIIGAHSHRASPTVEPVAGGRAQMVFSLGNLVFDQRPERSDGALAEVRVFDSGVVATRIIPLPHLLKVATEAVMTD